MNNNEDISTNEETLEWVKRKIKAIGLKADSNRDVYGSMHILDSGYRGMEYYIKSYKCDKKQGLIANLAHNLQEAVTQLEECGKDCSAFKATILKTSEILGIDRADQ